SSPTDLRIRSYTADLRTESTLQAEGGSRTTVLFGVRGTLHVATGREPGGERVVAALGDDVAVEFRVDGSDTAAAGKKAGLLQHLKTPFQVVRDAAGRVRLFYFSRDLDPLSRRLLRTLFTTSQLVVEDRESWTADESDATGDYVADYR